MEDRFEKAQNQRLRSSLLAVAKAVVDQETAQRGFLITGRDEFLQPYHVPPRCLVWVT